MSMFTQMQEVSKSACLHRTKPKSLKNKKNKKNLRKTPSTAQVNQKNLQTCKSLKCCRQNSRNLCKNIKSKNAVKCMQIWLIVRMFTPMQEVSKLACLDKTYPKSPHKTNKFLEKMKT